MSQLEHRDRVQLNVWVDREDHEAAHRIARGEERTLAGLVRHLLKSRIASEETP